MAVLFPDALHEAVIAGIEVPVSRRRVRGGRARAVRKYVYRDGQQTEDTGREPYAFSLEVPFFAGIDVSLWPDRFDEVRQALEAASGPLEYTDPFLGPLQVTVASWDEDMDAQAQDGVLVTLDLEEETGDSVLFTIEPDARAAAIQAAADADEALEAAGLTEDDVDAILDAANVPAEEDPDGEAPTKATTRGTGRVSKLVGAVIDGVQRGQQQADQIRWRVERVRAQVAAVRRGVSSGLATPWATVEALERAGASIVELGEALTRSTQVAVVTLPHAMSAWEVARLVLGDGTRAAEVLRANPTASPHRYRRGVTLRIGL